VSGTTTALTGSIAGTGGLNVTGGGTLDLTGLAGATFTGGVAVVGSTLNVSADSQLGDASNGLTLNGGTLNTVAGITSARDITLAGAGGTFEIGAGTMTTLSGTIGGAGSLAFIGGGTLTLTGANSYSGGTSVLDGTLVVGSASGLGTGTLLLDGSTLRATAVLSAAGGLSLSGASAATVDTNGNNVTFAGGLTGTNGLTKIGLGTLTLDGPIAYSGDMTINGGTLALGAANSLTGGNLTVASGATFNMNGFNQTQLAAVNNGTVNSGAGTLNAASYSGSGTLSVTLTPGTTSLIVSGTAALGGGKLVIAARPTQAGYYTIVQAGSVSGSFSTITLPLDTTLLGTSYTSTGLTLDLLNGYHFIAQASPNGNRSSVAQTLTAISLSANPSLPMMLSLTQIAGLTPAQLQQTFDQLVPTAFHAASMGMSMAGSTAQTSAVGQRLAGLRNGTSDGSSVASFKASGDVLYPGVLLAEAPGDVQAPLFPSPEKEKVGFYAAGIGTLGRLDGVDNANGSQPGFNFSSAGTVLGADTRISEIGENVVGGVVIGYTEGSASLDSGLGSITSDLFHYGTYGAIQGDLWYGSIYIGGSNDAYQAARNITNLGLTAKSNPSANEFNTDASAGYNLRTHRLVFSPFGDVAYDRVMTGGYSESGAGGLDMNVFPETANSLRTTLGLKISRKYDVGHKQLTPYFSGAWRHEFQNQSQAVDAEFASAGAPNGFTTRTADIARDGAVLGAGMLASLGNGLSAKLAYTGDMRPGFHEQSIIGEFRVQF
jgi:autotransporter-associated beta strand protein